MFLRCQAAAEAPSDVLALRVIDGSIAATFNASESEVYAEDLSTPRQRHAARCAGWDYLSPLRRIGPDEDGRTQDTGLSSVSQLRKKFSDTNSGVPLLLLKFSLL